MKKSIVVRLGLALAALATTVAGAVVIVDAPASGDAQATKQYCC